MLLRERVLPQLTDGAAPSLACCVGVGQIKDRVLPPTAVPIAGAMAKAMWPDVPFIFGWRWGIADTLRPFSRRGRELNNYKENRALFFFALITRNGILRDSPRVLQEGNRGHRGHRGGSASSGSCKAPGTGAGCVAAAESFAASGAA